MEKLDMKSKDKVQENIEKIRELCPNCVTEISRGGVVSSAVDFDKLKQEMSDMLIDEGEERYQMTWPNKRNAVLLANTPISATLRPCKEESVDFDNTKNLYIEGDNLDVLKLLQETYLGKIKMIYIDPPYNTGKDSFVYNDCYSMNEEEFLNAGGYYDSEGNRVVDIKDNNESNGRFHTEWLNMLYPRLRLARDLLTDDGVIFISIDDNEQANLKKICDEIFGKYINDFIWLNNLKGRQISKGGAVKTYEHILCYAKYGNEVKDFVGEINILKKDMPSAYKNMSYEILHDEKGPYVIKNELYNTNSAFNEETRPNLVFNILYNPKTHDIQFSDTHYDEMTVEDNNYIVFKPHKNNNSSYKYHAWRWSKEKILNERDDLYFDCITKKVYTKIRNYSKTNIKDIITDITNGNDEMEKLIGKNIFSFPKSVKLLQVLCSVITESQDIILDFFSGSATTAHATMQLNAEDGGNRKFIMVQLPEKCDETSEAYKAGFKNICEIGKERIRRAGKKIKEENPLTTTNLDTGFRVLKLDSSNMKDVYYKPEETTRTLLDMLEDNIKEDRTPLDLLFQVMLDLGHELSAKIEEKTVEGKQIFAVDDNDIIACFDDDITEKVVTEIAKLKPLYAVFRDSGMASDSAHTNFEQIFAAYSPNTIRKVI